MKIVSSFVREQKRYTKNDLKNIFSFDDAGVEKFINILVKQIGHFQLCHAVLYALKHTVGFEALDELLHPSIVKRKDIL